MVFVDLFIDYEEFLAGMTDEQNAKEWETVDDESVFDEEEFEEFEKHRIDEIRDSFAKGKTQKKFMIEK
jgi:hypothetical protein